ncbi:MAG: hypothetical protein M3R36_06915 [Bacteroidota bacterium]|nr:hypothetical protein [Bacteroidota bacterium]
MKFFMVVIALIALPQISFTQTFDSVIIGKKYKIILFDEKEIIGTIVSHDEKVISVKADKILMTIEKNNIFSISKDISPSSYKFLPTLSGGTVFNSNYNKYNGSGFASNFNIAGRFSYFYSEKKNLGLEISYTSFKNPSYKNGTSYSDGKRSNIDFIINAQFGTFDKINVVDVYLNLGAGMHIEHENSSTNTYLTYDSIFYTYHTPSVTRSYPLLRVGGGLIIKPSKNIGINIEFDIDAYGLGYFIFPAAASFPLRAGFSYYFMK